MRVNVHHVPMQYTVICHQRSLFGANAVNRCHQDKDDETQNESGWENNKKPGDDIFFLSEVSAFLFSSYTVCASEHGARDTQTALI